jgi:hypothetical protein
VARFAATPPSQVLTLTIAVPGASCRADLLERRDEITARLAGIGIIVAATGCGTAVALVDRGWQS